MIEMKWFVAPVSALSVIFFDGVMGGADTTTELQGLHLMFELMFILFLLISVFVVLPRFKEELLLRALQRSLLPPMRLMRVASS